MFRILPITKLDYLLFLNRLNCLLFNLNWHQSGHFSTFHMALILQDHPLVRIWRGQDGNANPLPQRNSYPTSIHSCTHRDLTCRCGKPCRALASPIRDPDNAKITSTSSIFPETVKLLVISYNSLPRGSSFLWKLPRASFLFQTSLFSNLCNREWARRKNKNSLQNFFTYYEVRLKIAELNSLKKNMITALISNLLFLQTSGLKLMEIIKNLIILVNAELLNNWSQVTYVTEYGSQQNIATSLSTHLLALRSRWIATELLGSNDKSANYNIFRTTKLDCELVVEELYFPKELE